MSGYIRLGIVWLLWLVLLPFAVIFVPWDEWKKNVARGLLG